MDTPEFRNPGLTIDQNNRFYDDVKAGSKPEISRVFGYWRNLEAGNSG